LWIGTMGAGLFKFNKKTKQFTCYKNDPTDAHSISHNSIASLYEDEDGNLWIGTGLLRFGFGDGLSLLKHENKKSGKFINYRYNPHHPDSLHLHSVTSIFALADKKTLGLIGNGCLSFFNRRTGKFKNLKPDPTDLYSISHEEVFSIYESIQGNNRILWLGTLAGLFVFVF